jgi:hypothetical protein
MTSSSSVSAVASANNKYAATVVTHTLQEPARPMARRVTIMAETTTLRRSVVKHTSLQLRSLDSAKELIIVIGVSPGQEVKASRVTSHQCIRLM